MEMLQPQVLPVLTSETEIVPEDFFAPLDFEVIYGRRAPLEIDLGCGDGSFLGEIAATNSAHDFLGIERLSGRVQSARRRIVQRDLKNARVLRVEISHALQEMLPAESVSLFHLMFPDPWPKRRHWRRRLMNDDFLALIHRALVPEGRLRIATDHADYFRAIESVIRQSSQFIVNADPEPPRPFSTFEKRFGHVPIYRLVAEKVSEER